MKPFVSQSDLAKLMVILNVRNTHYETMKLLTALTTTAVMFAGSASAFNPDHLQKLEYTGVCISCDLSDAYLKAVFQ